MFKLISNENMKIYLRLRTWILAALIGVAVLLVAIVLHSHQVVDSGWKQSLISQTQAMQSQIQHPHRRMPASVVAQVKQQIAVNQYDIQHNLNPNLFNAWSFAATVQNLSSLLLAFIVVVVGDIVAGEFSSGTVKMLLTQTATRSRVLLAKYTAALLFGLAMTAWMLVVSVVIGAMFFGFGGGNVPQVYMTAHATVASMTTTHFLLMHYGFLWIQIVMTATIAFMISTIFRSTSLAITISILAFLVGTTVVKALSSYHWVKYILFANTDLSQFVVGGPAIQGLTLGFSVTMLVLYFIVMNGLTWWVFVKRDVAYT